MNTFSMEIVAPDRAYAPREIQALDVPAEQGRLTVLARHEPFICSLQAGGVVITDPQGGREAWELGPGTMRVTPHLVTLLVHAVTPPADEHSATLPVPRTPSTRSVD